MIKLNECQKAVGLAHTVFASWRFRRASLVLAIAGSSGLVVHCGGSAPEAQTPASVAPAPAQAPATEAPADVESESAAPDADGAEKGAVNGPAAGVQPAPPPAQAPVLEERKPSTDQKRKERSSADDLAEAGLAERYNLPKALAAIVQFDAQLSAAIELSAPDCEKGEGFRRAVCQLAERICVLEDDLPSSGSERHCGDSRARCSAATSRYRKTCSP